MLTDQKEGRSKDNKDVPLVLADVSPDIFLSLMEFIYTNTCTLTNTNVSHNVIFLSVMMSSIALYLCVSQCDCVCNPSCDLKHYTVHTVLYHMSHWLERTRQMSGSCQLSVDLSMCTVACLICMRPTNNKLKNNNWSAGSNEFIVNAGIPLMKEMY